MKYVYLIVFFCFFTIFAVALIKDNQIAKLRSTCEARGGRLVQFYDSHECVDKNIFR
jgi:hypothetical protein